MQPSRPHRDNPPQTPTSSGRLAAGVNRPKCSRFVLWMSLGWSVALSLPPAGACGQNSAQLEDDGSPAAILESGSTGHPAYHTERIRGRVYWLSEALSKQFGISSVPEVSQNGFAVVTKDGRLFPIVENIRGRAFRKDERLREMELEIFARRHEQQPFIQILKLIEVDGKQRYEVDYWCDVCAIVMFEKGPCSCCQDDNRLRKRLIEDADVANEDADVAPTVPVGP